MASLKDELREYGKRAAHLSLPQDVSKAIVLPNSENHFTAYIPPSDGWLYVRANGKDISAEILHSNIFGVLSSKCDGLWGSSLYPCKKGVQVGYSIFGSSITDYWVRFIPTLGSST